MFTLVRAVTYATLFVGLVLVFVPSRVLSWEGLGAPPPGALRILGFAIAGLGAALGIWCVGAFIVQGKGTPAPFDPPRRLVERGPYRFVRNPMYLGAALAMSGAALVWRSWGLLAYVVIGLAASHVMVVKLEEPALRRAFGGEYEDYCRRVGRWWPWPSRPGRNG